MTAASSRSTSWVLSLPAPTALNPAALRFSNSARALTIPEAPPEPFNPEKALGIQPSGPILVEDDIAELEDSGDSDPDEEQWRNALARAKAQADQSERKASFPRGRGSSPPPIPVGAAARSRTPPLGESALLSSVQSVTPAQATEPPASTTETAPPMTTIPRRPIRASGTPAPVPETNAPLPRLSSTRKPIG
jgi:hypothetical protein